MGCVETITATRFPKQSEYVGKRATVIFHFDSAHVFPATIVRDDREEPYVMLFQLDNGRVVLDSECQYGLPFLQGPAL